MRQPHHRYSWRQYVEVDDESERKIEFFEGAMYAMAGGTPEHSALKVNYTSELRQQLIGKPCRVYDSDLRIRVEATGLGAHPDATVVCGDLKRDPDSKTTVLNPIVLVEVLSDSTEDYDRGAKFDNYRRITTLQEYVLVSQREQLVEVFHRTDSDVWTRTEARTHASVRLESIDCVLDVDRLYDGVELDS